MAGKTKNEKFLKNFGGVAKNDLTNILNCDAEIDENAATIIKISNYHDLDDILNKQVFIQKNQFKVLSFNTESIFSKLDNMPSFFILFVSTNVG